MAMMQVTMEMRSDHLQLWRRRSNASALCVAKQYLAQIEMSTKERCPGMCARNGGHEFLRRLLTE